jgi:lactobin A/cerein 7B family class IIb bacteriocin
MNTLNQEEMAQIEGGIAPVVIWFAAAFAGAVIGGVVDNVLDNWGDFKKGVMEGYSSTVASN